MQHLSLNLNADKLSLAAYASNLAESFALDITKVYCRKTGKVIAHRTEEEIQLLQQMFSHEQMTGLSQHLNLCDSVSPSFVKLQTEELNKLEDLDPVSLFVYYLNLLTRQFNQTINTKGEKHFVSIERENQFKNSLVMAWQNIKSSCYEQSELEPTVRLTNLNNQFLDRLKECNRKLRWLLTLNILRQRFYAIDITNALDYVSVVDKNRVTMQVDWLKRNNLNHSHELRYLKDARNVASQSGKIVEFTTGEGKVCFYDGKNDKVFTSFEDIPQIKNIKLRDFNEQPILPHELATSMGIDWIIKWFPSAFKKCKDRWENNRALGWHNNDGINKAFSRGNKTDEISNEFEALLNARLDGRTQFFVKHVTRADFNKTKRKVQGLSMSGSQTRLDVDSLSSALDNIMSSPKVANETKFNLTAKPVSANVVSQTFSFKPFVK